MAAAFVLADCGLKSLAIVSELHLIDAVEAVGNELDRVGESGRVDPLCLNSDVVRAVGELVGLEEGRIRCASDDRNIEAVIGKIRWVACPRGVRRNTIA
jgi:hypothetical protein